MLFLNYAKFYCLPVFFFFPTSISILYLYFFKCVQTSDGGMYCDAECGEENEQNGCHSLALQSPLTLPSRPISPVLHTCVPLDAVQPQRKRKSEAESNLSCKKLNPEEKTYIM